MPSVSSPSLFRLFQTSKANLNTSHAATNATSSSDENSAFNSANTGMQQHQMYVDFNDFVNQSSSSFSDNQPENCEATATMRASRRPRDNPAPTGLGN